MSALIYRRAFADPYSLQVLSRGETPDMEGVRRRLFVLERRSGPDRPDHFYKNYLTERLGALKHVHELPWVVLSALAERFVERAGGSLCIRVAAFADWQELVPMISPLAVCVAFLVREGAGPPPNEDPRGYLAGELGTSALLAPLQPDLQALIDREGLNELHMHLNGSTEADILWSDAVGAPRQYLSELSAARKKFQGPLSDFYDQIEIGLRPFDVYQRLRAARRVRHVVAGALTRWRCGGVAETSYSELRSVMDVRLADGACALTDGVALSRHPAATLFSGPRSTQLIEEAAFLYAWLQALKAPRAPHALFGLGLYYNFLVFTQISRISVQQIDEVGFDQFQKYTQVGVRERLERVYADRFRQLNVSPPYRVLSHLEGRLAPKNDVKALLELLEKIVDGYLIFRGCPARHDTRGLRGEAPGCLTGGCAGSCGAAAGRSNAELSLVIHFIKKRGKGKAAGAGQALDGELRGELRQQARVVRQVIERHGLARQLVRGIDAAANEMHAPPEAFAPTFRYLRYYGIPYATFHVGEDFAHLVSGIRATVEAQRYMPLGAGDRVGHATALGIPPALWLNRTGGRMMVGQGEHLDNLVFAYARLASNPKMAAGAQRLEEAIAVGSSRIYGREYSAALLEQAWRLRDLDILEILELERDEGLASGDPSIAAAAADKAGRVHARNRRGELNRIAVAALDHPLAYKVFRERHRRRDRLDSLMEIETAWLERGELAWLQAGALKVLSDAGVAIETLPTSNVRISAYHGLAEHHVFRWLGLTEDGFDVVPEICVGSDDPGIFATSLRNEYAAILEVLRRDHGMSADAAIAIIERLNRSGFAHRFRPLREARRGRRTED